MSWRDQMGPATFRGVPFFVDTAERSGGRRTVKHEYPNRDDPFIEDMGRRAGSYPVEGYVLGADYLAARNALIAALETEGPGELVHPYYGTLRVICSTFRVREAAGEGGVARLSIEFEQTTATPIQPTAVPDAGRLVISSANAAALAVAAEFQESFDPSGLPGSSLDSAITMVKSAGAAVDSAMGPIVTDEQALADLKRKISALSDAAVSLVRTPADLAASVLDVFATLNDIATIPGRAVASLLAAYGFTPSADRPPATTSTRAREQANYDAAQRFGQRMMIVQAARLAPAQTYDSYNAAVGVALAIALKLDAQLELAGDTAFPALNQLRADLVRAVPGEDSGLARLVSYAPAFTVPSLVLAFQLYGDVTREADIVARNSIRHPGFVIGGRALEVLSSG